MTTEQMARMEREMEKVQRDLKTVESRYGEDVLQLVIAFGYQRKALGSSSWPSALLLQASLPVQHYRVRWDFARGCHSQKTLAVLSRIPRPRRQKP